MIRLATSADLDAIERIYDDVHTGEEQGRSAIGWKRNIYPTRGTAAEAIDAGDMFVMEHGGAIIAAARINKIQVPEYAQVDWTVKAPDDEVMVLHTLAVLPSEAGRGYGSEFVAFYEKYALENGCRYLRMDTNVTNLRARALYGRLGYREMSVIPCCFNGIEDVRLMCLEKNL